MRLPRFSKSAWAAPLLLSILCAGSASAIPVEVSNPVAGFLRRLEEKGAIAPGFWSTLPREESEVAAALDQALRGSVPLTAWDRERLERYLDEFDPDRKKRGTRLHYEDSLYTLIAGAEFFAGGYVRDSLPKGSASLFSSITPRVEGTYRHSLDFTAAATVATDRTTAARFEEDYDPQHGLSYGTNREGKSGIPQPVSTFDGFRTIVGFGDPHFRLEAGQDWNQWGPGQWQHTTLGSQPHFWASDSLPANPIVGFHGTDTTFARYRRGYRYPGEGPPLPQIRFRMGGDRWEYVKIVAQRTGLSKDSSAYLIAHRAQLRLGTWKFGVSELLSVGTKSPGLVAFLPGIPLKFAEHSGGDQDNSAISGDVEWTWTGHGRFYGELFLDDFSGPPLDFWGDKFAYVLGASLQDPFGLPSEWHAEYAVVDPWVYGHNLYNTAMQSSGALLGSSLPPNSRAVFASADFPLPRGVQGTVEWRFQQRDFDSRGSSIFDVHGPGDSDKKAFLAQDVETRNQLAISADWSWRRYLQLKGGLGGLWVDTWHGRPGQSLATPTAFGEMTLRY